MDLTVDSDEDNIQPQVDDLGTPTAKRIKRSALKSTSLRAPKKSYSPDHVFEKPNIQTSISGLSAIRSDYFDLAGGEITSMYARGTLERSKINGSGTTSPKQFEERTGGKLPSPSFPRTGTLTELTNLENGHPNGQASKNGIHKPSKTGGSPSLHIDSRQSYTQHPPTKPSAAAPCGNDRGTPLLDTVFARPGATPNERDGSQCTSHQNGTTNVSNVEHRLSEKLASAIPSIDVLEPVEEAESTSLFPNLRIRSTASEAPKLQSCPPVSEGDRDRGILRHTTVDCTGTSANGFSSHVNPNQDLDVIKNPQIPPFPDGSFLPKPTFQSASSSNDRREFHQESNLPPRRSGRNYKSNLSPGRSISSVPKSDDSDREDFVQEPVSFENLKTILQERVRRLGQDHDYHIKVKSDGTSREPC